MSGYVHQFFFYVQPIQIINTINRLYCKLFIHQRVVDKYLSHLNFNIRMVYDNGNLKFTFEQICLF